MQRVGARARQATIRLTQSANYHVQIGQTPRTVRRRAERKTSNSFPNEDIFDMNEKANSVSKLSRYAKRKLRQSLKDTTEPDIASKLLQISNQEPQQRSNEIKEEAKPILKPTQVFQSEPLQTSRDYGSIRKHKAGLNPARRSGQKPSKIFADTNVHTQEYIRKNFEIPTASQYDVSYDLVTEFHRLLEDSGSQSKQHDTQVPAKLARKGILFLSTLSITLRNGDTIVAKGHGSNVKEARDAAALHALCQLHKLGALKELVVDKERYLDPGPKVLRREANAKRDVIDYAARHDCLPEFTVHNMTRKAKGRRMYRAHASIPQLGLNGYGRAITSLRAILAASLSLKQAAEARHAATGEGTLLIKDKTNLTTDSGKKFVLFYCMHQRLEQNTVFIELKEDEAGGVWMMKVCLKSPEIHQLPNDVSVLKRNARTVFDSDAWPGVLQEEIVLERTFEGIPMAGRDDAEDVGYLVAAMALRRESSSLWEKFVKEMRRGNGDILRPVPPIDLAINSTTVEILKTTLRDTPAPSQDFCNTDDSEDLADRKSGRSRQLLESEIIQKNKELQKRLERYETDPALTELRRLKLELPMNQSRKQVMKMINENDVCVVVGATGSGKTTQVPQLIMDDLIREGKGATCNIICTQPRRIAAVSVAQRVSVERNESLGKSVGYSVRFDQKPPEFGGSVHYVTTGILLRLMQDGQDDALEGISHIIVDEVHERDLNNDFLLVILKNLIEERRATGKPAIKIVLMSATIDTSLFCRYFGSGYPNNLCPFIEIPGRTFPVTLHFLDEIYPELRSTYPQHLITDLYSKTDNDYIDRELEGRPRSAHLFHSLQTEDLEDDGSDDNVSIIDWKSKATVDEYGQISLGINREDSLTPVGLMGLTIAHIAKTTTDGSILVFLPGLQEIVGLEKQLKEKLPLGVDFSNEDLYRVHVLHSSLPHLQQGVFSPADPGQRKIILATNIAETSITIPDVIYVVDSSKQREMQYDKARRISTLMSTWTAKSNAQQRAGRAGRVAHGHYYTMASRARYESFEVAPRPEILRTDLQNLCLQIKKTGVENIRHFLKNAIEPPSRSSVETAIDELQALGALDQDETLTSLGRYLSTLPLAPSIGKMLVLSVIFKCLDPILILAAVSSARNPFLSPPGKRDEAEECRKKWAMGTRSDQAAIIHAFQEWRRIKETGQGKRQPERHFAYQNFLHHETMLSIAQISDQLMGILQASGLVEMPKYGMINGTVKQYGSETENIYSDSQALQVALMTAGLYPNIAIRIKGGSPRFLRTFHENEAAIKPYSLVAPRPEGGKRYGRVTTSAAAPPGALFTFAEKTQGDDGSIFLRHVTRTFPLAVYLFGGRVSARGSLLTVDDWIPFSACKTESVLLQRLYTKLQDLLKEVFGLLGASESNPLATQQFLKRDQVRAPLVEGIVDVLESCAPKVPLALGSGDSDRLSVYEDEREWQKKDMQSKPSSSSRFEHSVDMSTFENVTHLKKRNIFGQAEFKPHEIAVGQRPRDFYDDGGIRTPRRAKHPGKSNLLDLLQKWKK
jgi:HrpA-like RNA helicase